MLSDWLIVRVTANPGEAFLDRMIRMVESARRQKTPNEIALTILLVALTLVFLLATATLSPFSVYSVVATSAANRCLYCVVAHGAILRIRDKNPLIADQVAVNHRRADLTPRRRAMLEFAMKVAVRSDEIEDQDLARLREHGFTDEDGWDIAAIAGFFAMSNRLANMAGVQPNREFHLMGR